MPNHVTNKISIEVAELLSGEDREIDFNKIIPMPGSLFDPDPQQFEYRAKAALGLFKNPYTEDKGLSDITNRIVLNGVLEGLFKPIEESQIELLIQAIINIKEHGFAYWRPWAVHNWGTKWGAYNVDNCDSFVTFQTAWSHPKPVFLRLSELNPELEIKVEYADEDIGSNCGTIIYKAGAAISVECAPKWNSLDADGKEYWQRFALSITDPDNIEGRMREYAEAQN